MLRADQGQRAMLNKLRHRSRNQRDGRLARDQQDTLKTHKADAANFRRCRYGVLGGFVEKAGLACLARAHIKIRRQKSIKPIGNRGAK